MAALTGLFIADSYKALLKTIDNDVLGAAAKEIVDGYGNVSGVLFDTSGNVTINGNFRALDAILDSSGNAGTAGQVLTTTGTTTQWQSLSSVSGVTGSGTAGYLPLWSTNSALTNSIAIQSGTTITIGGTLTATTKINTPTLQLTGGSGTQGTLSWNADEETVDLVQNGTTTPLNQATELHVKNQTGATIAKGTPVRASGTLGASGRILIAPMIANGTIEAKYFLGVTNEAIADGEDGKVITFGKIRSINTAAYTEGQTLWVSATTAGAFTTTRPVAPNLDLEVAIVINSHVNNGVIFVRSTVGHYLGTAHDVNISSVAENDLLVYKTNRWVNTKTIGDLSAANVTLSGYLRGPATFVIDPSAYGDETGLVQILGDLRVDGTTTTINSTTISVSDKNITLAKDAATAGDANGAGITIAGASATLTYLSATDDFTFNKNVNASRFFGPLTGDVTGTVSTLSNHDTDDLDEGETNLYFTTARARASFSAGTGVTINAGEISIGQSVGTTDDVTFGIVTASLSGNASTASALATARNIALDGSVTGNANFDGSGNITITTTTNHNHDDRYYTETESDNRFVNVSGDTMTGDFYISNAEPKIRLKENDTTNLDKEISLIGGAIYIKNLNDDNTATNNMIVIDNSGNFTASGTLSAVGYNKTNWDSAYDDKINTGYFNSNTGDLVLTRQDESTLEINFDDRYVIANTQKFNTNTYGVDSGAGTQRYLLMTGSQTDQFFHITINRAYDFGDNDQTKQQIIYQRRLTNKNLRWRLDGDLSATEQVFIEIYARENGEDDVWIVCTDYARPQVYVEYDGFSWYGLETADTPTGTLIKTTELTASNKPNWEEQVSLVKTTDLYSDTTYLRGSAFVLSPNGSSYDTLVYRDGTNPHVLYAGGGTSTQWNTAYGWGNHADGGYQAAATAITTSNIGSQSVNYATSAGNAGTLDGIDSSAFVQKYNAYSGGDHNMHVWNNVHATYSDNSNTSAWIVLQTSVPQDSYSMGGFELVFEEDYYTASEGGTLKVYGYWNAEVNSGFVGFKYTTDNPLLNPNIYVARNTTSGNTAFLIQGGNTSYAQIIARNLWLGYSASGANSAWGDGWSISQQADQSGFTNIDQLTNASRSYFQPAATAITTSNIGSQSVAYAANAGLLDSIDSTSFLRSDVNDTASGKVFFTHHTTTEPYAAVEINGGTTHTGLYINPSASSQAHVRFGTNGTLKWQIRAPFQYSADTDLKIYSWVSNNDMFNFKHTGELNFAKSSSTIISTGGGSDAFGYHTSYGHYIQGTGSRYIYGDGIYYDGAVARTLIHSGNIAAQSVASAGNADTLDSLDSSQFVRSDTNSSKTGWLAVYSTIGAADDVRSGLAHYDDSAMAAGVGGQIVLGYNYVAGGGYTEGAIIKMYKENSTSSDYSSGLKFQVRNTGAALSTKMTLDPSGRLGIGTAIPSQKLHLYGSGNQLMLIENVGTYHLYAGLSSNVGIIGSNNATPLSLQTNGTSRVYINTSGYVGIGTTNPNAALEVNGNIYTTSNTNFLLFGTNSAANPYIQGDSDNSLYIGTGGSSRIFVKSDGKVGVGTTNPSNTKVHIVGDSSFVGDYGYNTLTLEDHSGYAGLNFRQGSNNWLIRNDGSDQSFNFVFSSNASGPGTGNYTPLIIIKKTGEFGIGTTNPQYKLVVSNGGAESIEFGAGYASGANLWQNYNRATSQYVKETHYASEYNFLQGKVGIGVTSPNGKLDVQENNSGAMLVRFWNTNTSGTGAMALRIANSSNNNNGGRIEFSDTDYYVATISADRNQGVVFRTSATGSDPIAIAERMRITSDGKVGIGTTNPGTKLSVVGTIRSTEQVDAGTTAGAFRFYDGSTFYGGLGIRGWSGVGATSDITMYLPSTSTNKFHISRDTTAFATFDSANSSFQVLSTIGANDNVRYGITHYDNTPMTAGVGGQIVLGYYYTSAGDRTEGAIIKMYKENATSGHYGSGLKFQVRNTGNNLSTKLTLDPSGNLTAAGDVYAYSDARVKENVETINNALDKVMALRGVSYNRTDNDDKAKKVGVIAQEIQKVLPEVVTEQEDGMLGVSYGNIVGVLIEAIKELKAEIDELKKQK